MKVLVLLQGKHDFSIGVRQFASLQRSDTETEIDQSLFRSLFPGNTTINISDPGAGTLG